MSVKNVPAKGRGAPRRERHDALDEMECCGGTGHASDCEAREPAWDLDDLFFRTPCAGCCPSGHRPKGLQAMQDEAAILAGKRRRWLPRT